MESLDIKRHPSEKQIKADRAQVAEWLALNPITTIREGAWYRGGELVKKAAPPSKFETREGWTDSPWNWR